mmetsp:Transcript_12531/g.38964  ORF Transcript_12531/g.38964 Transcript_12531/m.38964 type:complete len:263 (-) Transcript_12531:369-1157(-)
MQQAVPPVHFREATFFFSARADLRAGDGFASSASSSLSTTATVGRVRRGRDPAAASAPMRSSARWAAARLAVAQLADWHVSVSSTASMAASAVRSLLALSSPRPRRATMRRALCVLLVTSSCSGATAATRSASACASAVGACCAAAARASATGPLTCLGKSCHLAAARQMPPATRSDGARARASITSGRGRWAASGFMSGATAALTASHTASTTAASALAADEARRSLVNWTASETGFGLVSCAAKNALTDLLWTVFATAAA